jgi:hypothetical protein
MCTNKIHPKRDYFCRLFDKQAAQALPSCAPTNFALDESSLDEIILDKPCDQITLDEIILHEPCDQITLEIILVKLCDEP